MKRREEATSGAKRLKEQRKGVQLELGTQRRTECWGAEVGGGGEREDLMERALT